MTRLVYYTRQKCYAKNIMRLMLKIPAPWLFVILLPVFLALAFAVDGITFEKATLALLAASFVLYVLYAAWITGAQQRRANKLRDAVRAEANAFFAILAQTRNLPLASREHLQDLCAEYLTASFRRGQPGEGEHEYQHLISYCLDYHGKDPETVQAILSQLSTNQTNRTQLAMQLDNRVSGVEWLVLLTLLVISLGFILTLNTVNPAGQAVQALLCTALTLQTANLTKLSSLTHKKAQDLWQPLQTLNTARFRRFD